MIVLIMALILYPVRLPDMVLTRKIWDDEIIKSEKDYQR